MHSSFSTSNAMIKKVSKRGSNEVKVTFVLPDDHTLGDDVSVVGDFNDWTAGENAFVRRSNQTYSTNVMLEEGGRYAFRYYSEESGWANEEEADDFETNEYGDTNCIVET
jgi:1,4-alpha-glucan branching enzyme